MNYDAFIKGDEDFFENYEFIKLEFDPLEIQIEDIFAKGDKAVFRATLRGAHKGNFMGIPPTGKSIEYTAIGIARFRNWKTVETRLEVNYMGLMQQLGMELKPTEAKKKSSGTGDTRTRAMMGWPLNIRIYGRCGTRSRSERRSGSSR